MTAQRCTQPGCGGTIQDGFCDVCGLAPAPAAAVPAGSGPVPAQASAATGAGAGS